MEKYFSLRLKDGRTAYAVDLESEVDDNVISDFRTTENVSYDTGIYSIGFVTGWECARYKVNSLKEIYEFYNKEQLIKEKLL